MPESPIPHEDPRFDESIVAVFAVAAFSGALVGALIVALAWWLT